MFIGLMVKTALKNGESSTGTVPALEPDKFVEWPQPPTKGADFESPKQPQRPARTDIASSNFEAWKKRSDQLRQDATLVVYYTMEDAPEAGKTVKNLAGGGTKFAGDLVDATWIANGGRFGKKGSLDFHGPAKAERLEVHGSADVEELSLRKPSSVMVWFQVRELNATFQAIIAKGDFTWRIHRYLGDPTFAFHTNPENGGFCKVNGPTNVLDKQWHQAIAIVEVRGAVCKCRFYLDARSEGEMISYNVAKKSSPVWIGGSSDYAGDEKTRRTFSGLIDEVAIWNRALPESEVQQLYATGKP